MTGARLPSFAVRLLALLAALAGCAGSEGKPAPAKLWTVEDIQRIAKQGGSIAGLPASALISLRGQPLPLLSPPYADTAAAQRPDLDGLMIYPAFSEGRPAAYSTTEVWQGFPAVWLQPLYLPITGFSAAGAPQVLPGALPVFGVGTRTRFYSPYWQVIYVTVPADLPADRLRSAKDVLDSGYPLAEGPGTFCALAPQEVHLAEAQGAPGAQRPLFLDRVVAGYRAGWVDGAVVWYIDFGRNRFTWSEDYKIIDEAALFDLGLRGPDGGFVSLGLPKVGGTGRFLSNTPARVQGNRPQFGALWRLHHALLPAGAGVFIPSARAGLRQAVLAAANQLTRPPESSIAPPIAPANEARADALEYTLRVAVNPTCFQDEDAFPQGCRWLDSQAAVEREIPAALVADTGLLFSCPFLVFDNQEIDP